jgi:hypothetical protein
MIKAKELRIGNWVQGHNGDYWCVTIDMLTHIAKGRAECHPIPLSPEVLTACGFIWDGECWNFDGFRIWDSATANAAKSEYYHINSETLTNFDFLHHLQNYYHAVSTEELEYKPK